MLVPWTPLAPSQRERRLRQSGSALAMLTAVTLVISAARADPFGVSQAIWAALLGIAAAVVSRPRRVPQYEIAIDANGQLLLRLTDAPDRVLAARCGFAAPWLISVKSGTMWVPIWPDSVPATTFRRLWVHIRWSSGRVTTEPSADRTGQPQ